MKFSMLLTERVGWNLFKEMVEMVGLIGFRHNKRRGERERERPGD